MTALTVWEKAKNIIKEKIGSSTYETWFSSLNVVEKTPQLIFIEAPDEFFKNLFIEHYSSLIAGIMKTLSQDPIQIEFSVNTQLTSVTIAPISSFPIIESTIPETNKAYLNPRFTFDTFVIGPANRLAHAACLAVAESPAKAYNPLFIYGGVGLGKTHLLQAITHKIQSNNPKMKHCYIASEKFTNELIEAIRHRSTTLFRQKYRSIDVLLIDDIQFIAGKESTQEEFFNTFNTLHDARKQIILTSDRPPKDIVNLEERLRSRFGWGLIADIQPPDFETRVAILRKKMEREPVHVPDDVIQFIAQEIKTNIRELEGALIRVVAYALLEEKPITLNIAKNMLKDMVPENIRTVNIEKIQKVVANFFSINMNELKNKRRNKNIVLPRQIAMFLSRQLTNLSLPEIGNAFGGKDHTTVLHSCKKIDRDLLRNIDLQVTINNITTLIQQ